MIGLLWVALSGLVYFLIDKALSILVQFGFGFIAYTGIQFLYDNALDEIKQMLGSLGPVLVDTIYILNLDIAISMILSASFAKFVMNTGMTSNGQSLKTAFKRT